MWKSRPSRRVQSQRIRPTVDRNFLLQPHLLASRISTKSPLGHCLSQQSDIENANIYETDVDKISTNLIFVIYSLICLFLFTIGRRHGLANVMVNDDIIIGWKFKILGYISNGDNVPDVITTDWNLSNIGLIAIEESRQLKCNTGFKTVGVLSSNGSTIIVKPCVYVETNVARCVTKIIGEKSVRSVISIVRKRDASLWAQNRKGFRSIATFAWMSFRNAAGDSWTTCWTRRRVFKYSTNRFRKLTKCSAFLILPGTTSVEKKIEMKENYFTK